MVICLICTLLAATLPSILGFFNAGADAQAHNNLSAQVQAARSLALQTNNYTLVHVQPSARTDNAGTCYTAIMAYDPANKVFNLAVGYAPMRVPGGMAFGELSGTFVSVGAYQNLGSQAQVDNFASFSIILSPAGNVVTTVDGLNPAFNTGHPIFDSSNTDAYLWASPASEAGVTAVTLFRYNDLRFAKDDAARKLILNRTGQFRRKRPFSYEIAVFFN